MKRELTLTHEPITESLPLMSNGMGAVVTFRGIVRGEEDGASITAINYEAHEKMALHQFGLIFDTIEENWPVERVRLIHRLGVVPVNEPSLQVEVIAPHRAEAFETCQFLIDEMKEKVPIWKRPQLSF